MKHCLNCNTQLEDNANFCIKCGVKYEAPAQLVCTNCNEPIIDGAKFCHKCGTKYGENDPASQYAPAPTAFAFNTVVPPSHAQPKTQLQHLSENILPKNNNRILLIAGGMFFAWFLFLLINPEGDSSSIVSIFDTFIYIFTGISVYLILQTALKLKIFGGAFLLCSAFFAAISTAKIQLLYDGREFDLENIFDTPDFMRDFGAELLPVAIIAAIAFLMFYLVKSEGYKKLKLTAWICGGAIFLFYVIRVVSQNNDISPDAIVNIILRFGIAGTLVAFSVLYSDIVCSLKQTAIKLTSGAKVWLCISLAFTAISLIVTLSVAFDLATLIITSAGITGIILLLCKKRIGYLITLLAIGINLVAGLNLAISHIIFRSFEEGSGLLFGTLLGAINPIITWLFIRNAWQGEQNIQANSTQSVYNQPSTVDSKEISHTPFDKFSAIFNLCAGGFLILFPFGFVAAGEEFVSAMLVSILPGIVFLAFALVNLKAINNRRFAKWMRVLGIIIFALCVLFLLAALVGLGFESLM